MTRMRNIPDASMLERETESRAYLNALDDTREAVEAFAERRTPTYTGR
jgi:hypothetical protein